jgi:hypothetical protein
MFRQDNAILRERLGSCWVTSMFNVLGGIVKSKETYNLVHLLVYLYIFVYQFYTILDFYIDVVYSDYYLVSDVV